MKKLLIILGVGVGLVVLAALVGTMFLGRIITAGVNRFGPQVTLTTVELAGADLSPLSGGGHLTGLAVGNPTGWSTDRLAYLGRAEMKVRPGSLLSEPIWIERIVIDQPEFSYETRLVSSNLKDLLANIEKSTGASAPPTTPDQPARKIVLEHFLLTNAQVKVTAVGRTVTLTLPTVELRDLGVREGGLTPPQLVLAITRQLAADIATAAVKALAGAGISTGDSAGDAAKKAASSLLQLLDPKKEPAPAKP